MTNGDVRAMLAGDIGSLARRRILVTGGQGMLGDAFARLLGTFAAGCEVRAPGKEELDVTNESHLDAHAQWVRGGWVIHCAALVNVEGCAKDPERAEAVIVRGTANVVRLAERAGARVFYPQSFLIYDGQENPIAEDCLPKPLSLYGQLKVEAERIVMASAARPLSVRMAGFFGGEARDKNFVGKLIPHLDRLIREGQESFSVGDRVWQPTWTDDLAMNSLGLVSRDLDGVFQMACHGEASFHDLAAAVARALGMDKHIEIRKVPLAEVSKNELGGRPVRAVLSCDRLRGEGLDAQRPWEATLSEYLSSSYFDRYRRGH